MNGEVLNILLQDIKEGDIGNIKGLNEKENEEFWSIVHSSTNLTHFRFTISNFKHDLEENLPLLIEKNPNLKHINIHFSLEIGDFDTTILNKCLQTQSFEKIEILFTNEYEDDNGNKIDYNFYLKNLFECFENCNISKLFIENVTFTTFNLKSIENINELKYLEVYMCKIDDKMCLNHSISASKLLLSNLRTSDDDLTYDFIKSFEKLEYLELSLPNKTMDCLKLKNSLEKIKLKELKYRTFQRHKNEEYLTDIFSNIERLSLWHSYGDELTPFHIFSFLKDHKTLKSFESCGAVKDFLDIDEFLKNNESIVNLSIALNDDYFHDFENQVKILAKGISSNHSIEDLQIQIPLKEKFGYLYDGIKKNDNFKLLDLSYCCLNNQSCKLLGDYFSNNHSLTYLNISNNDFTASGLKYICKGLMNHKYLKSLILDYNRNLSDNACLHLKDLLASNQSLTELNVRNSSFTENGLKDLIESLLFNTSLTHLNFEDNDFILKGVTEFKTNLFYNNTLREFIYTFITEKTEEKYIKYILQRNSSYINTLKLQFNHDIKFKFY